MKSASSHRIDPPATSPPPMRSLVELGSHQREEAGSPTKDSPTTQSPTTQSPAIQGSATQGAATQGSATQGSATQGSTTQGATTQGATTQDSAFCRVDQPHVTSSRSSQTPVSALPKAHGSDAQAFAEEPPEIDSIAIDSIAIDRSAMDDDRLLNTHAIDLVDRLQGWAANLDAREAQLNLRASMQDQRERQFRLCQQDAEAEMAEQQRSIDRLRRQIETQARRIAFQS